jgi:hypothetical protein
MTPQDQICLRSHHPWQERADAQAAQDAQAAADRQTAGLLSIVVILLLLICSLFLIQQLRSQARIEDCLLSGRKDCGVTVWDADQMTLRAPGPAGLSA